MPDISDHDVASAARASDVLASATKAFAGLAALPDVSHQLSDDELATATQLMLGLLQRAEQVSVALTSDAVGRGMIEKSTAASTKQWVQRLATGEPLEHLQPTTATSGPLMAYDEAPVALVVEPVGAASEPDSTQPRQFPRMPGVEGAVAYRIASLAMACRLSSNEAVRDALHADKTSPSVAMVALRHAEAVGKVLPAVARSDILGFYLMLPVGHTSRDAQALTARIVATYGGPEVLDDTERVQRGCESVTWRKLPTGLVQLIAELSAGHAAEVRQAIEALSAPATMRADRREPADAKLMAHIDAQDQSPGTSAEAGAEPDDRSPKRRQADALVELLGIAARAVDEGRVPSVGAARLVITFDYRALAGALAANDNVFADTGGHLNAGQESNGELLCPGTVRRMACDAELIPMVLGKDGVPLDVGKEQRLYTRALRQAVINRDRECTFPGCDRPPSFCQVHHILPWWCGGETSLTNGALLCGRHHTIVHDKRYTAHLVGGGIEWDLTPGLMPLIPAHHAA